MKNQNQLKYIFALLIFLDLGYSFLQHYNISIDGDLPDIILPADRYEKLMEHPLGLQVVLDDEKYASPNRYFAHWFTSAYFRHAPIFLQKIVDPIDSVYLACAFLKTAIQFFLLYLLAVFITGKKSIFDFDNLLVGILLLPLFHTTGYYHYMGVIDHATTYTIFYAVPLSLLLFFFLPFYEKLFLGKVKQISLFHFSILAFLTLYLSLNGPLIAPLVMLVVGCLGLKNTIDFFTKKITLKESFLKIGKREVILLTLFLFFSIYSFWIGSFNEEAKVHQLSLSQRYAKLPEGIFNILFQKLGFPILLIATGVNTFLIKKYSSSEQSKKIFQFFKWMGFFALIYILLLPLGGYREYRPNIVRRDTFLPITLCIFYAYGMTSFYLMKNILPKFKKWYFGFLILITLNFAAVDIPNFEHNDCERNGLEKIAASKDEIIQLDNDCWIMTWTKVEQPGFTDTHGEVLYLWNIVDRPILYFQGKKD